MSDHFIEVCSCGKVLSQCRCPGPHKTKRTVANGCEACKAKSEVKDSTRISGEDLKKRLGK